MMEFLQTSQYFGVALTISMFMLAVLLNRRFPSPFTTPLFLATIFVVIILLLLRVPYATYNASAQYITYFLVPVTVCFAVPMYRQLPVLRTHMIPILIAMLVGVIASVFSVGLVCIIFGLGDIVAKSLVSISVTTAIAIGITQRLGGVVALTVSAVIVTGILGASVSDVICKWLRLRSPIARGLAIGNASHAAGTAKAMEMGAIEGAMSSLAIVLSGLMTAIIAPFAIWILF